MNGWEVSEAVKQTMIEINEAEYKEYFKKAHYKRVRGCLTFPYCHYMQLAKQNLIGHFLDRGYDQSRFAVLEKEALAEYEAADKKPGGFRFWKD